MINKSLKKALLTKLKINEPALSLRTQKLKKEFLLTREQATYVIAYREGIDLSKYLNKQEISDIRTFILQGEKPNIPTNKKNINKNITKIVTINIAGEFKGTDPLLDERMLDEAKEMATIYPLLYVLENSIRQFICLAMKKYYGDNWWETDVSRELKRNVEDKIKKDHTNSWHQKRGKRPIDYLDLIELPKLFTKIIKAVPNIIPGPEIEWIRQLVQEVYTSRCVLCHMNPLQKDSITSVKLRFKQWQKQIQGKIDLII